MAVKSPIHEDMGYQKLKRVFFTGTTALLKGQGLCYDRDYGTATDKEGLRDRRVELPSRTNNNNFAGVTLTKHAARSSGQWITIAEPGSVVEILNIQDTVINTTYLSCLAGSGTASGAFWRAGFMGRGTALALETTTVVEEEDYAANGALDAAGTTITDAGATFLTDTILTDDPVYILAGEDDNTYVVTAGLYTVASDAAAETTLVISSAAADGGTMEISYVVTTGYPTCLAYLLDGSESGCVEVVQPTSGATPTMVGGYSYIHGGVNPGADATHALADGTYYGQLKAFNLLLAMTTNDYLITPATAGVQLDKTTALNTAELDGTGDIMIVEWKQALWQVMYTTGTAYT